MRILESGASAVRDPRLDALLAAIRQEWECIAEAKYPGLRDDAQDAVQTALVKLITPEKLRTIIDPSAVDRWARSIFVNTVLDFLRAAGRERGRQAEKAACSALPSPGPGPEDSVRYRELVEIVHRGLEQLEVARLRYVEDLPEREVAERVGATRDAVATRLKRFRRRLLEQLGK